MGEKRIGLPARLALKFVPLILVLAAMSCSMPRVVVLKDPLTAGEHNDLGVIYEQKGMLDLAVKEYGMAAAKQDYWAVPYFNLGNVEYKRKNLKAAEENYRRSLKLDPKNPDIMNNLAGLLHDMGRDAEAGALIDKALAIRHKDEYLDTKQKIMGQ